jgi:prenyltransferase beta subunit
MGLVDGGFGLRASAAAEAAASCSALAALSFLILASSLAIL